MGFVYSEGRAKGGEGAAGVAEDETQIGNEQRVVFG